ncbi:MAG: ATP-binding cassette domain-containing protein [Ilumatobacteraceae bacterium]
MPSVIECRDLTKRYGSISVVDGLDLTVQAGQVFGFVGPNGAGKTTTMRMLVGLVRPTRGRMALNGRPLPDPDGLDRIGVMIEEPSFYGFMSGRTNLETLGRCGQRLSAAAIDDVLERVALTDDAERKVKTYSQGMRQRLGLAAALMRNPDLLILDEPTNGMDPAGIRDFRALLRDLASSGTTVLLSSHLLGEVEHVCHEIAVLNRGRLVEQGPPGKLSTARSQVHVTVAAEDRLLAQQLLTGWSVRAGDDGELIVDVADGRLVNQRLATGGVWAERVEVVRPSLEEVFLDLTSIEAFASDRVT